MSETICRLCLQTVSNNNCEAIGESLLKTLKLNLKISKETVMCAECANSLQVFTKFAPGCVYMGDRIQFGLKNDVKLDPTEIEATINLQSSMETEIKCSFCTEAYGSEDLMSLNDANENKYMVNVLEQYISKTNLNNTEELLTCETCLEALDDVLGVILKCLKVEEKIREYIELEGTDDKGQVELKEVQQFMLRSKSESGGVDELEGSRNQIKEEHTTMAELEIKYEKEISHPELIIKTEDDDEVEPEQCDCDITDTKPEQIVCERLQETDSENEIPKDPLPTSETGKCDERIKQHLVILLQQHSLTHKSPRIKLFKCILCTYETKRKADFGRHLLIHKSPSEIMMFKCELCPYQAKRKHHLEQHLLVHKSPSKMKMLKCALCSYVGKTKHCIQKHLLIHKSPAELNMFKCALCSFEMKRKHHLAEHLLVHKSPSELKMFKCTSCSFETKRKYRLKRHLLTHKNTSEIRMFKCASCSYETKKKCHLERHLWTHKSPDKNMFKCATCSFVTKYERHLQQHLFTHKSSLKMFKCTSCSFKAKRHHDLKRHLLIHKNPSEIKMFKCTICSYKTKSKYHLKRHMLTHRIPP